MLGRPILAILFTLSMVLATVRGPNTSTRHTAILVLQSAFLGLRSSGFSRALTRPGTRASAAGSMGTENLADNEWSHIGSASTVRDIA